MNFITEIFTNKELEIVFKKENEENQEIKDLLKIIHIYIGSPSDRANQVSLQIIVYKIQNLIQLGEIK